MAALQGLAAAPQTAEHLPRRIVNRAMDIANTATEAYFEALDKKEQEQRVGAASSRPLVPPFVPRVDRNEA